MGPSDLRYPALASLNGSGPPEPPGASYPDVPTLLLHRLVAFAEALTTAWRSLVPPQSPPTRRALMRSRKGS